MSVSLNFAAKEISQYSYLYYKLGLNQLDASLHEGAQESREIANQTIDGISTFMDLLSGTRSSAGTSDFADMLQNIEEGKKSATSLGKMYSDNIANDPKAFILGMGMMAGNELKEEAKVYLGQTLARSFMQKNLMAYQGDDLSITLENVPKKVKH